MTRCFTGYFVEDGCEQWVYEGKLHRLDGPALVSPGVSESWYYLGKPHRDGGPAYIGNNGYQAWYAHGRRHRVDGPAIIRSGEDASLKVTEWWIDGEEIKSAEHFKRLTGCTDEYLFMLTLKYGDIG